MRSFHLDNSLSHSTNRKLSDDKNDQIDSFVPYFQSVKYPKLIQKHLARKHSNLTRAVESLKTPSKQFLKKEIRRLSELSKKQEDEFNHLVSLSSSKKRKLFERETHVQSELSQKGIDLENPILDIGKVFALPSKSKRRKHDTGNFISKLSQESSDFLPQENSQMVSMFDPEKDDKLPFSEIDRNLQVNDEVSYLEPETLFKEINTLNIVTELDIKESIKEKSYDYNDEKSFTHEMYKSDSKSDISNKENDSLMEEDLSETNENRVPYVPPPFAKVFAEL